MDDRRKTGSLDDRRSDVPLRKSGTLKTVWAIRVGLGIFLIVTAIVILLRTGVLSPAPTIQVPVTSGPIKAGQVIEATNISYLTLRKENQAADWIMDASNILGRKTATDIPEKKAFREANLVPKAAAAAAPAGQPLQDGWVAVIADPDRVEAPLHLMAAGTTVGILSVREGAAVADTPPVTLVSRRAIIVSLPHAQPDPAPKRGAAPGPSAGASSGLVLQMPPEDAVRFVKAHKEGRIHLVLLGPSGANNLTTLPDPGFKRATETVEIIRGTRRSVESPEAGGVQPESPEKPTQEDP